MINRSMFEKIYQTAKKYLEQNSVFSPKVLNVPKGESFPRVVIQMISNANESRDSYGFISHSMIGIEVDIYALEKTYGDTKYSAKQIAEGISDDCSIVFEEIYGMKRNLCQPTPNADTDVYRITMRYAALQDDKRNVLF